MNGSKGYVLSTIKMVIIFCQKTDIKINKRTLYINYVLFIVLIQKNVGFMCTSAENSVGGIGRCVRQCIRMNEKIKGCRAI